MFSHRPGPLNKLVREACRDMHDSPSFLDHIVIVAPNLELGACLVSQSLGVDLEPGGAHPRMATHNVLLRLGRETYLEVIAPDPAADSPTRPRWFELDRIAPHAQPFLATWVARTRDIRSASLACGTALGAIEAMSRGSLSWLITVPEDGSLPLGGAAPALIEWQATPHPAGLLREQGCSLISLEIFHPEPGRIQSILRAIRLRAPCQLQQLPMGKRPYLVARVKTPHGERTLGPPKVT